MNGKTVATKTVNVPASGRATVEFQSLDVPYGFTRCEVRIDSADALPADDVSLFRRGALRSAARAVRFRCGATRGRRSISVRALASAAESAFALDTVSAGQASSQRSLEICVRGSFRSASRFPPRLKATLLQIRAGRRQRVIAAKEPRPAHSGRIPGLRRQRSGIPRLLAHGRPLPERGRRGPFLSRRCEKADHWSGVKFYFAVRVDPGDARVVARLTDQTPLLLEKKIGEGTRPAVYLRPRQSHQRFSAPPDFRAVRRADGALSFRHGAPQRLARWSIPSSNCATAKEQAVGVEVIDPDGKRPLSLKEATSAQTYQLTQAGFYELQLANGRQDVIGVNADRRESNLEVIPDETLALWRGNSRHGSRSRPRRRSAGSGTDQRPYSLWWYIMLLVLAAAIAESLLADRYLGTQQQEDYERSGSAQLLYSSSSREALAPGRAASRRRHSHLGRPGRHGCSRPDHQRVCVFRMEHHERARRAALLRLVLAIAFGIAMPLYGAQPASRGSPGGRHAFPNFKQRLVTFAERDADKREPFLDLLAADTLNVARDAEPARWFPTASW